jgi:hypothetical protein
MFPSSPSANATHVENNQLWVFVGGLWNRRDNMQLIDLGDHGGRIGEIIIWMTTVYPMGYLLCDGSNFNVNSYPLLAQILKSNKLPRIDSFVAQNLPGHTNTPLGNNVPWACKEPHSPIHAGLANESISTAGQHDHLSGAVSQTVIGYKGDSPTPYYASGSDNHTGAHHGAAYTGNENAVHQHTFSFNVSANSGRAEPRPNCKTARAIIRAQ